MRGNRPGLFRWLALCMVLLCIIVVAMPCSAATTRAKAADDTIGLKELVRRIGRTYEESEGACELAARCTVTRTSEVDIAPETEYRLYVSRGRYRLEVRGVRDFLYIVNSDVHWTYHPDQAEYIEVKSPDKYAGGIRKTTTSWYDRLAGRFGMLPKLNADFSFMRWEDLKLKHGKVRCVVLAVRPVPAGSEAWQERLWVEPESALVRKSVMEWGPAKQDPDLTPSVGTCIWDQIIIGEPISPDLFVFRPPRGVKRVREFSRFVGH